VACFCAAAAGQGLDDLYLFAVVADDHMTDVDDALVAGVGALEAGVTRLYGVVVILGGWCAGALDFSVLLMEIDPPE